jgi:hypothetical protein
MNSQVVRYVTLFVLKNSDFLGSFLPPCSGEFKKRLLLNTILYYAEHQGSKLLQNDGNCFPVYILLYPIKPKSAAL